MHQSDQDTDDQIALTDLVELLNGALVPEHLKRRPNLAFLTQEQLAERWGLSIDTLRDYRSRGGGPVFFGGHIRGREVKYPIDSVLDYENKTESNSMGRRSKAASQQHVKYALFDTVNGLSCKLVGHTNFGSMGSMRKCHARFGELAVNYGQNRG